MLLLACYSTFHFRVIFFYTSSTVWFNFAHPCERQSKLNQFNLFNRSYSHISCSTAMYICVFMFAQTHSLSLSRLHAQGCEALTFTYLLICDFFSYFSRVVGRKNIRNIYHNNTASHACVCVLVYACAFVAIIKIIQVENKSFCMVSICCRVEAAEKGGRKCWKKRSAIAAVSECKEIMKHWLYKYV